MSEYSEAMSTAVFLLKNNDKETVLRKLNVLLSASKSSDKDIHLHFEVKKDGAICVKCPQCKFYIVGQIELQEKT